MTVLNAKISCRCKGTNLPTLLMKAQMVAGTFGGANDSTCEFLVSERSGRGSLAHPLV